MEVLELLGFGPTFRKWIELLYRTPKARIKLNGKLSSPFPIQRGTKQGCPLSPSLFTMVMEPLAEALRVSTRLAGIRIGSIVEKLALYTDNLILFPRDPGPSLSGGTADPRSLRSALRSAHQLGEIAYPSN